MTWRAGKDDRGRAPGPRPDEAEPPRDDARGRRPEAPDHREQPGSWGGEGGAGEYQGGPTTSRTDVSEDRDTKRRR